MKSDGNASLAVQNGDADWPGNMPEATLESTAVEGNEWHEVTFDYTTGENPPHLFIYMWSGDGATSCIDDVLLTEKTAGVQYIGTVQQIDGTGDEANDVAYYGSASNINGQKFGFTCTATKDTQEKTANILWNDGDTPAITGNTEVIFGVVIRGAKTLDDLKVDYYREDSVK